MKNKLEQFINRYWHWLIFGLMVFLALSFLIFHRGVWAFADSGFYYQSILQAKEIFWSKLGQFANTDGFYLGFDNSAESFSHLVISLYQVILTYIFGADFGQIVYYFVFYLLSFIFGVKLLRKILPQFGNLEIRLGALFIAFNPFALLISTLFAISYIYPAFIIATYALFSYLDKGKIRHLILSVFFAIYLVSYLRLVPIILLTGVILVWIFFGRKFWRLKRLIVFLMFFLICASPFLVSNILSLTDSSNIVTNYTDFFSKYGEANYKFKESFLNSFSYPGGFTPSSLSFYYNNRGLPGFADNYAVKDSFEFFKTIQVIFNISLLIFALSSFKSIRNLKIIGVLSGVFFLNTLGFFVNYGIFLKLNQTVLIFLYNDYGFIQFVQVILYAALIVILAHHLRRSWGMVKASIFGLMVLLYLLINLMPLLFNHYGLQKINQPPSGYQETFFQQRPYQFSEASLFVPYHWLKFDWSPYFIDLNVFPYSPYQSLIVPNLRVVRQDFVDFYNSIYDHTTDQQFANIRIFNLKNIFVFHKIEDANDRIDTYRVVNIENNGERIYQGLTKRHDLSVIQSNEDFTHFRIKDSDDFEFFIYSPKKLINVDFDNFYDYPFDLSDKPVLFNSQELHQANAIREINYQLNSPLVSYKISPLNANKYYVKINVNKNYPFLIQLNQAFSSFWRVYFITKQDWDRVECQGDWQYFKITNNQRCYINQQPFDLTDFKLLTAAKLKSENHFRGNIIGNLWLITPTDMAEDSNSDNQELYLMIYFDKQLYYLVTLLISGGGFVVLLALWFKDFKKHNF
ncbi:MAG: hypothetical protein RB292_03010 [Patescibacteria group bacterium]|jgi:hypothetical protein|nr:hypothetical protein [Patescibacteria group bacterium]